MLILALQGPVLIQGYEMTIDIPEDKLIAGVDEVGRGPWWVTWSPPR